MRYGTTRCSARTVTGVEPESGAEVLRAGEATGGRADVGRTLHGGWHADRGLGGTEKFSSQGRGRGSGSGGDFHGEPRRNRTHASNTDPEARLYKKSAGQEAKLSYLGHTLVENRDGLIAAHMRTTAKIERTLPRNDATLRKRMSQ